MENAASLPADHPEINISRIALDYREIAVYSQEPNPGRWRRVLGQGVLGGSRWRLRWNLEEALRCGQGALSQGYPPK